MKDKIKLLASDTLIYGISGILGRFLSFLLTPIYSNYLSVTENGELITIFSLIAFLNIIYSFGMESAFFRFYKSNDLAHNKKVFSNAFLLIVSISFIFSLNFFLFADYYSGFIDNFHNGGKILRVAAFLPFLDSLIIVPFALLRMQRSAKKYAYLRFFAILINVALNMFFVVNLKMGEIGVFISQAIASSITVIILSKEIIKHIDFQISLSMLKEMLKYGLPTLSSGFSGIVLQVSDKLFYQFMTNSSVVGMYGQNYKLGIPMMLLVSMFETAWKPFYLSNCDSEDAKQTFARVFTYFTIAGAFVFLFASFYIDFVVMLPFIGGRFINPIYWSGLGIVPIILAAYYFNGATTNIAAGLYITKNTRFLPIALGLAALSNLIANFVFIPLFGIYGGAWATLLAYIVEAIVVYYYAQKVYPNEYEWNRIAIIFASVLTVFIANHFLSPYFDLYFKIAFRTILILAFLVLLKGFKFFNDEEIALIKRLIKKK